MIDIHTRLATLKRPPLLARAARFSVDNYRRDTHLRRILQVESLPRHAAAIMQLFDIESDMEAARQARTGTYSAARHIEVLTAIAGEAQLLAATPLRAVAR